CIFFFCDAAATSISALSLHDALPISCRDGALATRNAAVGTWPTSMPALIGTPIDHVLATPNWTFTGFRVLSDDDSAGSDHRPVLDRKSTRLNSSHSQISYAVFCLKKK